MSDLVSRGAKAAKQTEEILGAVIEVYPERANLFQLNLNHQPVELYVTQKQVFGKTREEVFFDKRKGSKPVDPTIGNMKRALQRAILGDQEALGYKINKKSLAVVNTDTNYAPTKGNLLQIYSAFKQRVLRINDAYYLCLDHQLVVRSILSVAALVGLERSPGLLPAQRVLLRLNGTDWQEGKLVSNDSKNCHLVLPSGDEITVTAADVFPDLNRSQIASIAPALGIQPNVLEQCIKQYSFLTVANAPRARLEACSRFAARLANTVFPIRKTKIEIGLDAKPVTLSPPGFFLGRDLEEPKVSFDHVDRSRRSKETLSGLLNFGAYDKPSTPIRLALVTTADAEVMMRKLIDRLNGGSLRYPGAGETFGCNIELAGEPLVCLSVADYESRLNEFVRREQRGNADLAFVYLPKDNEVGDPNHPYYRVKALLLEEGLASQMVDRATLVNPEWRDLNLALNVYAKAGNIPWVLDEAMSGVDMFIGLSSSQLKRGGKIVRMMSYVNVFDEYGRWRFYQSDTEAFAFEDRLNHYGDIVKNSVAEYRANSTKELGVVQVHLTKKFSKEERRVLAEAVRDSAPGAAVIFVSINPHHPVRLYDLSDSHGEIGRATYLRDDPGRIYLATTGENEFRQKGMGTPVPLELTIWADPFESMPATEHIAQHVLSLTRLNWASSRSFCREPITTKFAGDIAKQMTAFMQDPKFFVNPILRGRPWFL